jgi:hypothetical protein
MLLMCPKSSQRWTIDASKVDPIYCYYVKSFVEVQARSQFVIDRTLSEECDLEAGSELRIGLLT